MIGGNSLAVFFFKGFVTFYAVQVLGCKDDVIQLVSFIIDGLQGGEGDIRFVCLAVSLVIVEAYYLIGHSTGIDKLSDGFSMRFSEKDICRFLMEDDDFTSVFQVVVVDETSVRCFHGFHFGVVGIYAQQRDIDIFLSEADVYITLPHGGTGTDDIFSELLLRVIHVPVVQLDAASFFQTVV